MSLFVTKSENKGKWQNKHRVQNMTKKKKKSTNSGHQDIT